MFFTNRIVKLQWSPSVHIPFFKKHSRRAWRFETVGQDIETCPVLRPEERSWPESRPSNYRESLLIY